jgi:hypothetical protein
MQRYRLLFLWVLILACYAPAVSQEEEVVFDDPPEEPIPRDRRYAEPVGGYDSLLRFLEAKIAGVDSTGEKFRFVINHLQCFISPLGKVDSTYIINHMSSPLLREVAKYVAETKWYPAVKGGKRINDRVDLGHWLYFNKSVYRKYGYRPRRGKNNY